MSKISRGVLLGLVVTGVLAAGSLTAQTPKGKPPTVNDAVGDPIGDQQGTDLDLQVVNAFTNGDSLTVELIADQPFAPPIAGGIFIDTDQDPGTGSSDVFGGACPTHSAATGAEFVIAFGNCTTSCDIVDDQFAGTGAVAAAQFNGNRAVFTAALSDLGGDDGIADIEVIAGNTSFSDCGPGIRSVESNASITADYPFDGDLTSRTLNAPDATETRTGSAFTTENVFGTVRPVRTFDAGNGLRIDPADGLFSDDIYTIQMEFRMDDVASDFFRVKLIDFGDLADDTGLYFQKTEFFQAVRICDSVGCSTASSSSLDAVDRWIQLIVTRAPSSTTSAGSTIRVELRGVEPDAPTVLERIFFSETTIDETELNLEGALAFLDDDSATGGGDVTAGAIACLRIHPTALGPGEIADLDCEPLRVGLNGNACAYSTINEAVSAAQSGDEVFIEVGDYNERIGQISNKELTLRAATVGSNCTLPESSFSGNRAVVDGTGFSTFSGIGGLLDIRESSISLIAVDLTNGATGQGGLVYVRPGSSFSTEGSTLSNGSVSSDRVNPGIPSDTADPAGGCVYAEGAEVSFTITTFTNCRVVGPNNGNDPADGDGGAIHARAGSTVSGGLAVSFNGNSARDGGAIVLRGSSADLSEILFVNNAATRNGGAIGAIDSPVTLGFNSTFRDNAAENSGGAISLSGQTLDVTDAALFEGNGADQRGGAIRVVGGDLRIRPSTDPVFFPSRFNANTAQLTGGAIYIFDNTNGLPNPTIQGIEFVNNSTANSGGALSLLNATNIEVVDSSFSGNSSSALGGAVYSQGSTSTFRSSEACKAFRFEDPNEYCSQFVGNTAGFGSAIYYRDNSLENRVLTTAFVGNSGQDAVEVAGTVAAFGASEASMESVWFFDNSGNAVRANGDSIFRVVHGTFHNNAGSAFVGTDASSLTMLNSIAFGNTGGGVTSTGTGPTTFGCNIDQSGIAGPNIDPLFVNDGDGDSHLDRLSPAVNVCSEQATLDFDLEGRGRSEGPAPDMGAFEYRDVLFENGFEQPATR